MKTFAVDRDHVVHHPTCSYRGGDTVPYKPVLADGENILEHLQRRDLKDKISGDSVLRACECLEALDA